ncbi:S-layer homology domain-containing protein [Gracilibacillus ureilyticus]|uniref:S-layer homology domain-containing protein n=1 Tax=Gracilibacillus ureilyticus TaxID=531814 RepID=A0A1H9NGI3_9BACI|nr:S-layer homology domain-containing protein [Gracilibacillus ureilyticus]SER35008.1 S-layer homology domain-containing protein [Gracilibacillus ureilyticus]
MKWKIVSAITLTSAIAVGGLASTVSAEESSTKESVTIEEKQTEAKDAVIQGEVSEADLIAKIKDLFPEKFGSASSEDFHLEYFSPSPEYGDVYSVYYASPKMDASFEFAGEDLSLLHYNFYQQDMSDALYPPQVSKQEAEQLAIDFINQLGLEDEFELSDSGSSLYYYNYNRPLTEPIEYEFHFNKLENGIPVNDQNIYVTIYGNGEVGSFNSPFSQTSGQYESTTGILDKDTLLQNLKDELNIELQYIVMPDYITGNSSEAYLTYREVPAVQGISAKNGKYFINGEYVDELEKAEHQIKLLESSSKEPAAVTKEEAKALVESLLDSTVDGATLSIDQVFERKLPDGTEVFEVHYMYSDEYGGFGSSISVNKNTGELLDFHKDGNFDHSEEVEEVISREDALNKAVEYIEQYAYSNMEEYAYPISSSDFYSPGDYVHSFSFPRVKNGLLVEGDSIHVGISKRDGSLVILFKQRSNITNWPSADDAISEEVALEAIKEEIDLELYYVNDNPEEIFEENPTLQYKLNYLRDDRNNPVFFNAISGDWEELDPYVQLPDDKNTDVLVSHPWAEDELNFLISNGIITVDDPDNFDGDANITKGEALEIVLKSLTYVDDRPYYEELEDSPFNNIGKDHPLYFVVMQAVEMGILDTDKKTFDENAAITTEELASWYVKALGLDYIGEKHDMFQYDFEGADEISDQYRGYVALSNSFGLLEHGEENYFHPKDEVSYAQIAVTNLKLVKLITSENFHIYY